LTLGDCTDKFPRYAGKQPKSTLIDTQKNEVLREQDRAKLQAFSETVITDWGHNRPLCD